MAMENGCIHLVGNIAGTEVTAAQWNEKLMEFVAKVDAFYGRGQRHQNSHPGYIVEYNFCPSCGHEIEPSEPGLFSYETALKRHRNGQAG